MTDKQIIIDGVDVRECEYHLKMTKCRCTIQHDVYKCLCEENPNCYFKQLKRKEQECEELKKTIMYKCPQCGDEYLSPIGASLHEENNKLKQTLTEIEDIAEEDFNHTCWETYARQLEQILQKISEYKGEYNET